MNSELAQTLSRGGVFLSPARTGEKRKETPVFALLPSTWEELIFSRERE
jgi:hypothetical protein